MGEIKKSFEEVLGVEVTVDACGAGYRVLVADAGLLPLANALADSWGRCGGTRVTVHYCD